VLGIFERLEQARVGRDGERGIVDCVEGQVEGFEVRVGRFDLGDVIRGEAVQPLLSCCQYAPREQRLILIRVRPATRCFRLTLVDQDLAVPYAFRDRLLGESFGQRIISWRLVRGLVARPPLLRGFVACFEDFLLRLSAGPPLPAIAALLTLFASSSSLTLLY